MSASPSARLALFEPWIGVVAVATAGVGTVVTLAGVPGGSVPLMVGGGGVVLATLAFLVAAGWLEGLVLVVLSLPLPALLATDQVRLSPAAPLTAAMLCAWAIAWTLERRRLESACLRLGPFVALAGIFIITTALSEHPVAGSRESVNMLVLLGFTVFATDQMVRNPHRGSEITFLLALVASITGGLAILEGLALIPGEFPRWGTPFNRAALGFGQPNGLALFLAVALPLVVHHAGAARSYLSRVAWIAAVGTIGLGLVFTFSRGSWIALMLGSLVLLATRRKRQVLRIWIVAAVFVVAFDLASGGALVDTVQRSIGDWVIEQRAALTLAGLLMFLAHPLLGVGPGGFAPELDRFGAQIVQLWDYLPTPHNAFVQMAAETGAAGFLIFSIFLGSILLGLVGSVRAMDNKGNVDQAEVSLRLALLWAFATAAVAGLFIWPLAHGPGQAVLLVAAIGLSRPVGRPAPRSGGAHGGARSRAPSGPDAAPRIAAPVQ